MPAPKPRAAMAGDLTEPQQPQSTFAIISSRRCTKQPYNDTPSTMSVLTRIKARIRALAAISKHPQPNNTREAPESTTLPHPHLEEISEAAPLKTRIQDRLAAIGACAHGYEPDAEDPIPAIPIAAEPPNDSPSDSPAAPFDVHDTLLSRTAARYAAARAFSLGLPAPDREELVELCDKIARRAEQPEIVFSLEGTHVPRGVPKGRVARFIETGLLEVETGMEIEGETGTEGPSEEEDSLAAEKAAATVKVLTKRGRGRVRDLWKTRRQGREMGGNCRGQMIRA